MIHSIFSLSLKLWNSNLDLSYFFERMCPALPYSQHLQTWDNQMKPRRRRYGSIQFFLMRTSKKHTVYETPTFPRPLWIIPACRLWQIWERQYPESCDVAKNAETCGSAWYGNRACGTPVSSWAGYLGEERRVMLFIDFIAQYYTRRHVVNLYVFL